MSCQLQRGTQLSGLRVAPLETRGIGPRVVHGHSDAVTVTSFGTAPIIGGHCGTEAEVALDAISMLKAISELRAAVVSNRCLSLRLPPHNRVDCQISSLDAGIPSKHSNNTPGYAPPALL